MVQPSESILSVLPVCDFLLRMRRASMPAGVRSDQGVLLQELLAAGMNPIFMAAGPSMQKQKRFSRTVCLLKHVDTVDLRASSFQGCSMAAGAPRCPNQQAWKCHGYNGQSSYSRRR
jgi:hypothetical protein